MFDYTLVKDHVFMCNRSRQSNHDHYPANLSIHNHITPGARRGLNVLVVTINHGRPRLAQDIDFLSLLHCRT